jgi:CBS-domain-containing membrane protein
MPDLSANSRAQRLRIYIGESDRWQGKPLYAALLDTLRSMKMAGATVTRGVAGFGAKSHLHVATIEALSTDLPLVVEVVDTQERITQAIDRINPMVREGLVTLEDVQVIKYTHRFRNPLPADRLVSDAMTREVASVQFDAGVQAAWKLMLAKAIKVLPVVDGSGKVVGILTDEDLLERAGIQQRLSVAIRMNQDEIDRELITLAGSALKVADVMTKPALSVLDHENLGAATQLMIKAGLKRLPVVDDSGKLVGILSRLDILRQVATTSTVLPQQPISTGAVQTVKDIMTTDMPLVNQEDDLTAIIDKFSQSNSTRLIVIDSERRAIGLISDSDVVARVQPAEQRGILDALRQVGKPPIGTETAFDLMSRGCLTAAPDLSTVEATKLMLAKGRKWLVVVDEQDHPLGLVDRRLLLESLVSVHQ